MVRVKDYEMVLDALQMTGIYVIKEENHEILYYNKRVREVAPHIKKGMICHEIWKGTCANCPLLHIGDKKTARSVNYDDPFGKAVEIAATRLLWEDKVPAFLIAVTPYAEVANYVYHKVLRVNLTTDTYNIIKADEEEVRDLWEHMSSFSGWMEGVAADGYIYGEDVERYRKFMRLERMRGALKNGGNMLNCIYRRRVGDQFRWHTLEVVRDFDYADDNQKVMIYVKDVHQLFREGLEREEVNIRNQEIISSLGEMFFATYYIDLEKDTFRAVTQKEEVGTVLKDERSYSQAIQVYAGRFVHPDDREEYLENACYERLSRDLNREHPLIAWEYRMASEKRNRRSWIRATVVLAETTKEGRPKRALYVAQDVTESKLKEEREQHALKEACEAANHANAAKSEFMSRMSHDIRTPMNAIIGMTAIAGRYLEDPERVADCLSKITVSSRHLLSLINEVLDMSKIESGRIDLAEEEINLSDLVENLMTMIRPAMEEKNHNLDMHVVNVEHEHVIGDSMRIQQIFMNILGNAVKYTPAGGNIEIEINEKPSHIYGYGCYEFIFRDNGIGMSREFQEKMFEPFTRAEDSRVSKIEGTGLGMTIARNIARRMNGDIIVKSELGRGTEFAVTLFFKLQDVSAPDTEKLQELPVLVADDDEAASELTCMILENIGMKGEYVLSGREAVERVWERHQAQEDYFAVILDWKMPEMDGIETARAIREKVGPDIPIIILSAYDWSGVEEEARRAGVSGFISKPLFKSRLVYLFNQIVGQNGETGLAETENFAGKISGEKRVLLVEDNELNREIAVEIIGQTGVTVEWAENGLEALKRFEASGENYYDMIFMDIQMPVMNGYEAARAIRNLSRADAARIPIVAMTANAFAEDIRQSRSAGMNEHLTKPLDVAQLMTCMERWLGGKSDPV